MKSFLVLAVTLALSCGNALAYYSAFGNDPTLGNYDYEYKVAVKSETASYSDAITKGHGLYYTEGELTGLYKVSRFYNAASGETATASKWVACIAARDVATGDVAGFPCVTKGYIDYALYDAVASPGAPISVGSYLCVGTDASVKGRLIACAANVTSPIIALEAKASTGTGTIKVMVDSK